jgi:Bardet-Biedl syndrome 7 protein
MGNLIVFVMPKPSTGNKTCQVLDIPLKPLNLHERIDKLDDKVESELALSRIKITGKFSLTDAHNWISNCLPDVPPNASQDEQNQTHTFYFRSLFIGTHIILELSRNVITIASDNLSVITIVKVLIIYT